MKKKTVVPSNRYCFSDKRETVIGEKHPEIVEKRDAITYKDNARWRLFFKANWLKLLDLSGNFLFIHPIQQILHRSALILFIPEFSLNFESLQNISRAILFSERFYQTNSEIALKIRRVWNETVNMFANIIFLKKDVEIDPVYTRLKMADTSPVYTRVKRVDIGLFYTKFTKVLLFTQGWKR